MFKDVVVEGLVARSSDHNPIFLSFVESKRRLHRRGYVFKFKSSWLKEEECQCMVEGAWSKKV